MLVQEHKQHGLAWQDEVHSAKKAGWHLRGAEATAPSAPGERPRCGTAVAVRSHIGVARARNLPYDASPSDSPGRIATVWADGILRGGVLLISVYLWHSEGLTERNWGILRRAAEAAKKFGGPFVIAGDFNMEPEKMREQEQYLRHLGAKVVAPSSTTCTNSGGGSSIDYFLVDERIAAGVVGVDVDLNLESSPHHAVVLRLATTAPQQERIEIKKAKAFPARRPEAPARPPDLSKIASLQEQLDSVEPQGGGTRRLTEKQALDVDDLYQAILAEGERQLCGLFDCVQADGTAHPAYVGRGAKVQTRRCKVVAPRARENGMASTAVRGLTSLAVKLREMAGTIKAHQRAKEGRHGHAAAASACTGKRAKQFSGVRASLRKPAGALKSFLQECGTFQWAHRASLAADITIDDHHAVSTLLKWSSEARNDATSRAADEKTAGQRSWWRWVDDQLRVGAAALHKLSKRELEADPTPLRVSDGYLTISPQDQVQDEAA